MQSQRRACSLRISYPYPPCGQLEQKHHEIHLFKCSINRSREDWQDPNAPSHDPGSSSWLGRPFHRVDEHQNGARWYACATTTATACKVRIDNCTSFGLRTNHRHERLWRTCRLLRPSRGRFYCGYMHRDGKPDKDPRRNRPSRRNRWASRMALWMGIQDKQCWFHRRNHV